jgi:hypothetical protein
MTSPAGILLYFAPVTWDSYPQRPHYFAQHFLSRADRRVVWIDPYPTRFPSLRDFRKLGPQSRISLDRPAGLTVISLRALPLEPLAIGRWLNRELVGSTLARGVRPLLEGGPVTIGVGRPSSLAVEALRIFRHERSFYDAMDNFPEFYHGAAKRSVIEQERRIVDRVDVVMTSSSALWAKFESVGSRRIMVHNAFEMSALPHLPIRRNGHRVFGYVGCIGSWFDWPITIRLAEAFPDVAVHLVGPCFAPPPGPLPANVQMFPACPLDTAIEHFQSFSVGLIPFQRTPLTAGVDPVKYYGYRGMALPVLSTAFGEMAHRGADEGSFLMDGPDGLVPAASAALSAAPDANAVEAFRQAHTWERRFDDPMVVARVV